VSVCLLQHPFLAHGNLKELDIRRLSRDREKITLQFCNKISEEGSHRSDNIFLILYIAKEMFKAFVIREF